ncbi:hypothetical protein CERSUDRAFT_114844 [Gelatoporia subvermispora B]|uniref:Uncharacterized protein n=1 Tax=Ceriporiopsis subvermispora (strain B) TaxID=914234 RepID=M2RDR3_CERS8|nr:hypothetical protein CERSUDRAFT_114844 [Gelatoporia subvermispora B]
MYLMQTDGVSGPGVKGFEELSGRASGRGMLACSFNNIGKFAKMRKYISEAYSEGLRMCQLHTIYVASTAYHK